MRPTDIKDKLGDLPYMRLDQAEQLFSFLRSYDLKTCLELGFYHGVSSAYIAGALQELGTGSLTTIDLEWARQLKPNIYEILTNLGLEETVTTYFEPVSYNWRLMKFLEVGMQNSFDFCYIDGGHNWYSTGFAFCLVGRLLRPGGWIIFDDLDWTHEDPTVRGSEWVSKIPVKERTTAQVRNVFELLVKTDPAF